LWYISLPTAIDRRKLLLNVLDFSPTYRCRNLGIDEGDVVKLSIEKGDRCREPTIYHLGMVRLARLMLRYQDRFLKFDPTLAFTIIKRRRGKSHCSQ
jgi:hypothetical protein